MDKDTRNAIERATQRARKLLQEDFAAQLEGDFDVHRDGVVAARAGGHLSARQAFQRERIIAALEHKRAAGMNPSDAVLDYLRDAAFTTFNRFVALKMLEARELVQQCITKGEQSAGYREFCGMAPGLPLLPNSAGYRFYIECLFDELSTEVKVLFDRRDPSSVLWPKRATFERLLDILNASELAKVWAEDETIGWVYQFFNGQDERRKMREESQAPRNGRELAVRNQFFTPRYVVQFLTDNTLGRIWYEMHGTNTVLAERCEYMVHKPSEEFAPRVKKDPRDLRVLDPACGSGHFLLYAFDLLVAIYEEAFADPESPKSEATSRTLSEDYPDIDALRRAVPGLILANNLHGVDIDPRCAQIAQLALWMRTQRAFRDFGIARVERPIIKRANIVIAEPMPGEKDLLGGFLAELREDRLEELIRRALDVPGNKKIRATKAMADSLAELISTVWEGMELAGEMGTLLKIEEDIAGAIERGRAEWEESLPLFRVANYGLGGFTSEKQVRVVPGEQEDFWSKAERLVFQALADYVAAASASGNARRRLFAEDAAQGFALADLAAKKFDVVLMNPPFGAGSTCAKKEFEKAYPRTKNDIYAAFVERGIELLGSRGRLGAITSRTGFFLTSFQEWREQILLRYAPPVVFADLGMGVLDSAMVETAAYCLEASDDDVLSIA
ncbi:DNA methyltransferase [Mesorhizobium sp.]|uniref:Eco57I restriction-modification methylase domain-containing protein n=1 Tax=Mesorhizobium sp. TaxID=1871066 RepID=UPI000FE6AF10|nr:DNA methyltransferase [Mesorhizobium sp.]RWD70280.1 MAG: class I SAM-dependent DNA methyltransferase [Mesorhizobium sp.]